MARTVRAEFRDRTKANIYARDRAMCSYTGMSLWLLDFGAAPTIVDQVDHVVPASKGGSNDEENGVLCNFLFNYLRSDKGRAIPLFDSGLPNKDAFWVYGTIPSAIMDHIERFSSLHYSDWYLNRAIAQFRYAATHVTEQKRNDGQPFVRGVEYNCKGVVKRLSEWRAIMLQEKSPTLAARGLLPAKLGPDHEILLQVLEGKTMPAVKVAAEKFEPYINASYDAVDKMFELDTAAQLQRHMEQVKRDPCVVERTKRSVVDYLARVLPPARTM